MTTVDVGGRPVGDGAPAFIIAEAGSNHDGDLESAFDLIDAAAQAGADAVKFQTFRARDLYVSESGSVEYLDDDRSIYDIVESMEMPYEWIPQLAERCEDRDIQFLSTPFDEQSADELESHVTAFKVASYTMSHHPFLRYLAGKDCPLIVSTGAHSFDEVREAVDVLLQANMPTPVMLQCVAAYPAPLEASNLRVIRRYRETLDVLAGLSDHTLDPVVAPTAAVALGACVIEKHITLDKDQSGPDHRFALEPDELETMVDAIRDTEAALGSSEKRVLEVEGELHDVARRSIQATRNIAAGKRLTADNVGILRSGQRRQGLPPKHYDDLLGRAASRDIDAGEGVTWDDVGE